MYVISISEYDKKDLETLLTISGAETSSQIRRTKATDLDYIISTTETKIKAIMRILRRMNIYYEIIYYEIKGL